MTPFPSHEHDPGSRIGALESALGTDPSPRAYAPLAEVYRLTGRLEEALRTARRGSEAYPEHVGILVVLARALSDSGDREGALEVYSDVLGHDPDNLEAQSFAAAPEPAPRESAAPAPAEPEVEETATAFVEDEEPAEVPPETETLEQPEERAHSALSAEPAEAPTPEVAEPEEPPLDEPVRPPLDEPVQPPGDPLDLQVASATGSLSEELAHLADLFVPSAGPADGEEAELGPSSIATLTLAEIYSRQGLPEKAAEVCERILERDPGNEQARSALDEYRSRLEAVQSEGN